MIMLLILIQPLQSLFYDKYVAQTGDTTKTIIASTASPFKFNQSVLIALEDRTMQLSVKTNLPLLKETF